MATNPVFAGGETPTSLVYPAATAADQAFGSQYTLDPTTKNYVFAAAAVTLLAAGYQVAAECQLADGSRAGFVDTTYAPTAAQVLYGVGHAAY